MFSGAVVKVVDVIRDILLGLLFGVVGGLVDAFDLERFEEAFDDGIVPAVSFPGHAGHTAMIFEHDLLVVACILAAPIRMMEQGLWRLTESKR